MRLPFSNDRELRRSLSEMLGFYPHRIRYYKRALLHKSVVNQNRHTKGEHNERLEFLGDAILDAIVGDIVFHRYKGKSEGFLTNTRSKLVQREMLNKLAKEIGLNSLIQSNAHSSSHNSYMGGNAFEALVGAIYLDRGYDACMFFMRDHILKHMVNIDNVAVNEVNFKSKLIEWSQKNHVQLEFRLVDEQIEHRSSPYFMTRIVIEGFDCEMGKGYSKKESQQRAAQATLQALKDDKQLLQSIFDAKSLRTAQEEEPTMLVPNT